MHTTHQELEDVFLQYLLKDSSILVAYYKPDGTHIYVSPNISKYGGYQQNELVGYKPFAFIHPEDVSLAISVYQNIISGADASPRISYRFRNKNGKYFWVVSKFIPIRSKGKLTNIISITKTINKSKEFELKLKTQENINEEISNLANIGYWEIDLRTNYIFWSPKVYEIHQVPLDEKITLSTAMDFYGHKSLPILQDAIDKAISTGESYDLKLRFKPRNKTHTWVRTIGVPIFEEDECIKLYGVFQDITSSVKDENLRLSNLIQFLSNQNRKLRELGHIISHDFRGPLSSIKMLSDHLDTTANQEALKEFKCLLNKNTSELLNKISILNKSLEHTLEERPIEKEERCNIQNIVKKTLSIFNPIIEKSEIKIYQEYGWKMLNYPAFIIQSILHNLIQNGISYTDFNKKEKWIKIVTYKEENIHILTIEDNGIGFPEKIKEGHRFKMGDKFHTDKSGEGMGLFLVQTQVESNNGDFKLSKTNNGTKVQIRFDAFKSLNAYE